MSKYLLKISGSNQIVNTIDWDGITTLTPPPGYTIEEYISGSGDTINYFAEVSESSRKIIGGELYGSFEGELTGSILLNGKTFDELFNETQYGLLQVVSGSDIIRMSESNGIIINDSEVLVSLNNLDSDKQTEYSSSFAKILSNNITNYIFKVKRQDLENKEIHFLVTNTEITASNTSSYVKLTTSKLFDNTNPFNSNEIDLHIFDSNVYVDFDLGDKAQAGNFYGNFIGNVVKLGTKTEKTIFTESGEYDVPDWATKITVIAIGAGGGGGGGCVVTYDVHDDPNVGLGDLNVLERQLDTKYGHKRAVGYSRLELKEPTTYGSVYGGGGGAGGNISVATFDNSVTKEIYGKCYVTVGKGGRGGSGGRAIYYNNETTQVDRQVVEDLMVNLSTAIMTWQPLSIKPKAPLAMFQTQHHHVILTRSGLMDATSGGDSSFICPQTAKFTNQTSVPGYNPYLYPQVIALGGMRGNPGIAVASGETVLQYPPLNSYKQLAYKKPFDVSFPDEFFGDFKSNYYDMTTWPKPTFENDYWEATFYMNHYVSPGMPFTQDAIIIDGLYGKGSFNTKNYVGGTGGYGISIAFDEIESYKNDAVSYPLGYRSDEEGFLGNYGDKGFYPHKSEELDNTYMIIMTK
jgi:hypothetical protein